MKEFGLDLSKALTRGLRSEDYQTGEMALVECFNAVPEERGLVPYKRPSQAIEDVPDTEWPFPRVFIGGSEVFLATADKLYRVDGSWELTELCDASQIRDMADFGDYVVFSGYNQVIVKDTEAGTFAAVLASNSFPEFQTCCNFNGQLVVGHIESSWYGCGSASVGWSGIGRADFTVSCDNEAGFRRVHWNKIVWRVKKLGETVRVYGDNGIAKLFPHEQTFGYKALSNKGLYSRWALAGTEEVHYYIDSDGELWRVDENASERLGYKEFLSQLMAYKTTANYDLRNGHVYFSDGTTTYVYNGRGLFSVGILPTSVFSLDTYLIGLYSEIDDDDLDYQSDDMVATTDVIQPEIRAMKTVAEMLVDAYASEGYLYGGAYYKYTHEALTATEWNDVNEQGRLRLQLTAPDIQVRVRIKNYDEDDDRISRLNLRVQYPDSRYKRGA